MPLTALGSSVRKPANFLGPYKDALRQYVAEYVEVCGEYPFLAAAIPLERVEDAKAYVERGGDAIDGDIYYSDHVAPSYPVRSAVVENVNDAEMSDTSGAVTGSAGHGSSSHTASAIPLSASLPNRSAAHGVGVRSHACITLRVALAPLPSSARATLSLMPPSLGEGGESAPASASMAALLAAAASDAECAALTAVMARVGAAATAAGPRDASFSARRALRSGVHLLRPCDTPALITQPSAAPLVTLRTSSQSPNPSAAESALENALLSALVTPTASADFDDSSSPFLTVAAAALDDEVAGATLRATVRALVRDALQGAMSEGGGRSPVLPTLIVCTSPAMAARALSLLTDFAPVPSALCAYYADPDADDGEGAVADAAQRLEFLRSHQWTYSGCVPRGSSVRDALIVVTSVKELALANATGCDAFRLVHWGVSVGLGADARESRHINEALIGAGAAHARVHVRVTGGGGGGGGGASASPSSQPFALVSEPSSLPLSLTLIALPLKPRDAAAYATAKKRHWLALEALRDDAAGPSKVALRVDPSASAGALLDVLSACNTVDDASVAATAQRASVSTVPVADAIAVTSASDGVVELSAAARADAIAAGVRPGGDLGVTTEELPAVTRILLNERCVLLRASACTPKCRIIYTHSSPRPPKSTKIAQRLRSRVYWSVSRAPCHGSCSGRPARLRLRPALVRSGCPRE